MNIEKKKKKKNSLGLNWHTRDFTTCLQIHQHGKMFSVMTYSTWVIIRAALGWRLVTFHIVIHFLSFKNKRGSTGGGGAGGAMAPPNGKISNGEKLTLKRHLTHK